MLRAGTTFLKATARFVIIIIGWFIVECHEIIFVQLKHFEEYYFSYMNHQET